MSVLKSKRGESPVQYLDTARKLEVYTLRQLKKLPKRYTFLLSTHLASLSLDVYDNAKRANSIFPKDAETVALRRKHLIEANGALQCLISQLDVVKELAGSAIEDNCWVYWNTLIGDEARLIAKVMKADAEKKFE